LLLAIYPKLSAGRQPKPIGTLDANASQT